MTPSFTKLIEKARQLQPQLEAIVTKMQEEIEDMDDDVEADEATEKKETVEEAINQLSIL